MNTDSAPCHAVVPRDRSSPLKDLEPLKRLKREEAHAHHYRTIWTKEPHGGEYAAASFLLPARFHDLHDLQVERRRTFDAPVDEAGYERIDVGPTTNIVGNHMTQAAIDSVRAGLEAWPSAAPPGDAGDTGIKPNLKRPTSVQEGGASHRIDRYNWCDCGPYIKLEASLETQIQEAHCEFYPRALKAVITSVDGRLHVLSLSRLRAQVNVKECQWVARGCRLSIVLAKTTSSEWESLVAEHATSQTRDKDARLEGVRRTLVLRHRGTSCNDAHQFRNDAESASLQPLTKVERRVGEEELSLVQKLTLQGTESWRVGDDVEAQYYFRLALEEITRLASFRSIPHNPSAVLKEPVDGQSPAPVPPPHLFAISADLHHRMAKSCLQTGQMQYVVRLCAASIAESEISCLGEFDFLAEVLLTRAAAYEALEDYEAAQNDFRDVLKHSRNRRALDGLRRVRRLRLAFCT